MLKAICGQPLRRDTAIMRAIAFGIGASTAFPCSIEKAAGTSDMRKKDVASVA